MNTAVSQLPVSAIDADARASFVLRTYIHLFGAILLFVAIEAYIFTSGLAEPIATTLLNMPGGWLVVLGGFVVVSWIASRVAATASSSFAQYAALGGFVLAEAIIFVPLLFMAAYYSGDPGMINKAAWVTLMGFTGLTAIAVLTLKDFSFLGGLLRWGFIVAIVLFVAGVLFSFELGTFFAVAMIGLAGAAILYDTSNILHHYPEDKHVAASLQLFASVALMFWYVLRLFLSRD